MSQRTRSQQRSAQTAGATSGEHQFGRGPSNRKQSETLIAAVASDEPESRQVRVRRVAAQLRAMTNDGTLCFNLRAGECIIRQLFGGNPRAFRGRPPFLLLVEELTGFLSKRQLEHVLDVYRVWEETPELAGWVDAESVTAEQLDAVRFLDSTLRVDILAEALREGWTSEELKREADARANRVPKGGRPRTPADIKWLESVGRVPETDVDTETLAKLPRAVAAERLANARTAQRRLREISLVLAKSVFTAAGRRLSVIIVDDENSRGRWLKRILERIGADVDLCVSGLETLALSAGAADAAVVDLSVCGGAGEAVARELLSRRIVRAVVFVSGFPETIDRARAAGVGLVVDHLDAIDDLPLALLSALTQKKK